MYSETLFSRKKKEMLLFAACIGLQDILLSEISHVYGETNTV